jgi:hypothetical protein
LNCEAPLAGGLRWCDSDCRDDYERLVRAQLRAPPVDDE